MDRLALAMVLLLMAPLHASGQELQLHPQELQRYRAVGLQVPDLSSERMVGKVIEADPARLTFQQGDEPSFIVPVHQIRHVEVMVGKEVSVGRGVLGFVIGAVVAGVGTTLLLDGVGDGGGYGALFALSVAAPAGGVGGAIYGALTGRPKWAYVTLLSEPGG
jgi:hypothetical protein